MLNPPDFINNTPIYSRYPVGTFHRIRSDKHSRGIVPFAITNLIFCCALPVLCSWPEAFKQLERFSSDYCGVSFFSKVTNKSKIFFARVKTVKFPKFPGDKAIKRNMYQPFKFAHDI